MKKTLTVVVFFLTIHFEKTNTTNYETFKNAFYKIDIPPMGKFILGGIFGIYIAKKLNLVNFFSKNFIKERIEWIEKNVKEIEEEFSRNPSNFFSIKFMEEFIEMQIKRLETIEEIYGINLCNKKNLITTRCNNIINKLSK